MSGKAFWIFENMKEAVDILPERLRGSCWKMIIDYAFGDDCVAEKCKNKQIERTFKTIKPFIRLRGIAGSQNGKSNNPTGLAKNTEPNIGANIGANPYITETETETETRESIERKDRKEVRGTFIPPTLDDFLIWAKNMDDTAGVGGFECSKQQAIEFWNHYNSQDWKKGNGLPITNLRSAFISWTKKDDRFQQIK